MSVENRKSSPGPRLEESGGRQYVASIDERREATRFERDPATDFAVIWKVPGEETLAEVHDESLTGLGLILDDVEHLELGSDIDCVYAGAYMAGMVRHIRPRTDGRFLVGISCKRLPE